MTCLIFFKSTIIILLRDGSGGSKVRRGWDFVSMSCAVWHNKYNHVAAAAMHAASTNRKEMTGNLL